MGVGTHLSGGARGVGGWQRGAFRRQCRRRESERRGGGEAGRPGGALGSEGGAGGGVAVRRRGEGSRGTQRHGRISKLGLCSWGDLNNTDQGVFFCWIVISCRCRAAVQVPRPMPRPWSQGGRGGRGVGRAAAKAEPSSADLLLSACAKHWGFKFLMKPSSEVRRRHAMGSPGVCGVLDGTCRAADQFWQLAQSC